NRLKPLGHPARNATKFFATQALEQLRRDEKWLARPRLSFAGKVEIGFSWLELSGSSLPNEVEWRVYQLHQTHSQLRFSNSCRSTFGLLSGCSRVKKLLALLLALWVCEFVTPSPNRVWNWR